MEGEDMNQIEKLLGKLVSINSAWPNEGQLGQYLFEHLQNLGFKVKKQSIGKGRFNLLASKGQGTKAVCFYGHLDTVPVDVKSWVTPPFRLTKKSNRWFGSGSYDMKGGVTAFIQAAQNSNKYIKLFLAVDEENISEGAWKAVKEQKDFFSDIELIISAEPNFNNGINSITRGRTGRVVFNVDFKGKAVHAAQYKNGIDAVELAGKFINVFYLKRENLFNSPKTTALIKKVEAQAVGMSVCGEASLEVEIFLGNGDSIKDVQKKLQSMTEANVNLKPRKTPYLESYYFGTFPYHDQIAQIIKSTTNQPMKLITRSSVGDDNVLASLNIPVITWGPDGGNAHTANEWISFTSLELLSNLYSRFLDYL